MILAVPRGNRLSFSLQLHSSAPSPSFSWSLPPPPLCLPRLQYPTPYPAFLQVQHTGKDAGLWPSPKLQAEPPLGRKAILLTRTQSRIYNILCKPPGEDALSSPVIDACGNRTSPSLPCFWPTRHVGTRMLCILFCFSLGSRGERGKR